MNIKINCIKMLNKYEKPGVIFFISILFLVFAHLTYSELIPNSLINAGAFLLILFLSLWINFPKKSLFFYISIMLICGTFNFAPSYGGLFVILSGIAYLFFIFNGLRTKELHYKDPLIRFLLLTFIFVNLLGLIFRSPIPVFQKMLGFVSLIGYVGLFNISRYIFISNSRLKSFLIIISLLSIYLLLTAINSGIGLLNINSPLILRSEEMFDSHYFISVIGRSSGEFGLLIVLLLLPFIYSSKITAELNINKTYIYSGAIASLLLCLVAFSKSQTIFLFLGLIIQFIFIQFHNIAGNAKSTTNSFVFVLVVMLVIGVFNPVFNFNYIFERFQQQPELIENVRKNIFEATGTSREESFRMGIERLKSDPWIIGYGWAPGSSNRYAWFEGGGWDINKYDFHNLYYSMPPVFGWIGTFSFLGIVMIIIKRLIGIIPLMKRYKSYLIIPAIGFLFFIMFFLVAEYTTNTLTSSNFFMIVWIFLGLSYSTYYTFKESLKKGA